MSSKPPHRVLVTQVPSTGRTQRNLLRRASQCLSPANKQGCQAVGYWRNCAEEVLPLVLRRPLAIPQDTLCRQVADSDEWAAIDCNNRGGESLCVWTVQQLLIGTLAACTVALWLLFAWSVCAPAKHIYIFCQRAQASSELNSANSTMGTCRSWGNFWQYAISLWVSLHWTWMTTLGVCDKLFSSGNISNVSSHLKMTINQAHSFLSLVCFAIVLYNYTIPCWQF